MNSNRSVGAFAGFPAGPVQGLQTIQTGGAISQAVGEFAFKRFPLDLQKNILSRLTAADRRNFGLVSQSFRAIRNQCLESAKFNAEELKQVLQSSLFCPKTRKDSQTSKDFAGRMASFFKRSKPVPKPIVQTTVNLLPPFPSLRTIKLSFPFKLKRFETIGAIAPNLKKLDMPEYFFTHAEVFKMIAESNPKLESLLFSVRRHTGEDIFESLKLFSLLREVNLRAGIEIRSEHFFKLSNLTGLTSLHINECPFLTDEALLSFSRFVHLENFSLANVPEIMGSGFLFFKNTHQMKSIHLEGFKKLRADQLEHISPLTQLRTLNICNFKSSVTVDLGFLKKLKSLNALNLSHAICISQNNFDNLRDLTNLTDANFSHIYKINSNHANVLSRFGKLKKLNFSANCNVGDVGVEKILALTNLEELDISRLYQMDSKITERLTELQNLRSLNISKNNQQNYECVAHLSKLKKLEVLNISGINVLDNNLMSMIAKFPNLTSLDISGSPYIDNQSLVILRPLRNLQELSIKGKSLFPGFVEHLGFFPELKKLNLKGQDEMVNQDIKQMTILKKLEDLNVRFCSEIRPSGIKFFLKNSPNIRNFEYSSGPLVRNSHHNDFYHRFTQVSFKFDFEPSMY